MDRLSLSFDPSVMQNAPTGLLTVGRLAFGGPAEIGLHRERDNSQRCY